MPTALSVTKRHARPDERHELRCIDLTPAALCHVQELEGHEQALLARARALGHTLAQPHRDEGRLDDVPVLRCRSYSVRFDLTQGACVQPSCSQTGGKQRSFVDLHGIVMIA